MMNSFLALGLSLLLGAISFARQQEPSFELKPDLPYQAERSNPVTYDVDFSVVVTPPYKTKKLSVWLPIPTSDAGQEVTEGELSSFPIEVQPTIATESQYGNRFAYFEFQSPNGAQIIRHRFRVNVWELRWHLDPEKIKLVDRWPDSFDVYRRGDSQAVLVDERFVSVLNEIVPARSSSPFQDFSRVLDWVQDNVTYDHEDASLRASAEQVLTKRRGHCSDYHSFCASMGRQLGLPSRVTYGINPFPKNSPSHCKLEVFLAPYGWVSFDVSETQKLVQRIQQASDLDQTEKERLVQSALARLASGFRDNTWFLQTRGTDYELVPPASRRVPIVRTAYIEADGVPLPDPDPSDPNKILHAWMTVHQYRAEPAVAYPFSDWTSLQQEEKQP
jgi:transglutaminase-like putative cysteine protease